MYGAKSITLPLDDTLFVGAWSGVWTNASISVLPPLPPSSHITAPVNGAAINATTFAIAGTALASCPYIVEKAEISINNGPCLTAAGTEAWNYARALPSDGNYTMRSHATDNGGNQETPSLGSLVAVDNTDPVSTIRGLAWNTINGIRCLSIEGTATDRAGSGVVKVQVGFAGSSTLEAVVPT